MTKQGLEKVRVFSLGGVGEIGKNMYVIEVGDDLIVIDSGLMFPDDDMLGVDVVIPDISYLLENKHRVKGIILTHGHEDHIGAVPYVIKQLNVPLYGTKLTLGIVKEKLKENGLDKNVDFKIINNKTKLIIGTTTVNIFRTNHSIPDSVGVCIETNQGSIVHTGDFKFDQNPVDGVYSDIGKMAEIGENGVLCLLSDSTNAERPGVSVSESAIGQGITDAFYTAKGRVIVATFASNIHRIQQVVNASISTKRKVAVSGRSMEKIVSIAIELGYLNVPTDTLIKIQDVERYEDDELTILTTGSQGEPMSALSRMAKGAHKQIAIRPTDTIIISATPIPGNEKSVTKIVDLLYRTGAEVVFGQKNVHTTGHGCQEELKLMLNLMKPKYFIPIHGEFRMQHIHSQLAHTCGVKKEHTFLIDKGDVVEFTNNEARINGKVHSGNVLIDGIGIGDVGNIVLRDRRLLSKDGILVVVVTLNKANNAIVSGPDIISRGFVYVRESETLLEEANKLVTVTLNKCIDDNINEWSALKSNIRDALSRFLFEQTRRRPMILPIIMEV
ncbi:Zn-dependent hydrolase [Anaerobacillus arseniciselenatis]|uniref:Ribonuclease J n=1 Tax=Anaerobacillus arseniciselenatis TaxID=85682 RepID=A0A1S2LBT2_9BACI|nr:ribonuclease J [Anaerobacillus arseniciselenatis]OIJ09958.1 Zn-dependent hydrolase [Anaerobacillus arseniciselenatis]